MPPTPPLRPPPPPPPRRGSIAAVASARAAVASARAARRRADGRTQALKVARSGSAPRPAAIRQPAGRKAGQVSRPAGRSSRDPQRSAAVPVNFPAQASISPPSPRPSPDSEDRKQRQRAEKSCRATPRRSIPGPRTATSAASTAPAPPHCRLRPGRRPRGCGGGLSASRDAVGASRAQRGHEKIRTREAIENLQLTSRVRIFSWSCRTLSGPRGRSPMFLPTWQDLWSMVYGLWSMVYGLWSRVRDLSAAAVARTLPPVAWSRAHTR